MEYLVSSEFFESLLLLIIAIVIMVGSRSLNVKFIKKRNGNPTWYKSVKIALDILVAILLLIIGLLIMDVNGIDVTKMIRSLGVLGIVVGYALNDLLKDCIMGLSIMFEGYFKVGDTVIYQDKIGKVISFTIKTTKIFVIETEEILSVSNRNITEISIASDWIDVDFPIGYEVNPHMSREICRECARRIERLRYVYSCDFLNTQNFEESWVTYRLRVHCLPEKRLMVRRNANAVIQDVFYEKGIEFPLSIKVFVDEEKRQVIHEGGAIVSTSAVAEKRSYEYGRGADKSKICIIDGSDNSIEKAIKEAERYAGSENLDKKMQLRIRLLSEELLSLSRGLTNLNNGKFRILRDGEDYDIEFSAAVNLSKNEIGRLSEVSSSGENDAYAGITGTVKHAIDEMISLSLNENQDRASDIMDNSIGKSDEDYRWSYNVCKDSEEIDSDEADELVKSVLTSMADDIKVFVRRNRVNIRVLVKSMDE